MPDTERDTGLGPETGTHQDQERAPNASTAHQKSGDARLPSDTLDRDRASDETIPRKSSLT